MTKKLTKVAMTTALAAAAIVPAVVATPAQAAEAEVAFAKAYYTTDNGTGAFEAGKLGSIIAATNDTKVTYLEGSNGEVFEMKTFSAYFAANPTATPDEILTALSTAGKALSADQVKALDVKEGQVEGGKVTVDPTAVQKTALNEAIAKAEASPKAAELKDAITAAKAVAENADATQAEVDEAVKALNEAIAEAEAVKELKVESVSAINAKTLEVTFNKELTVDEQQALTFDVKKDGSAQLTKVEAFEGKTAQIVRTNGANYAAGDYTVTVKGLAEDVTIEATVQAQKATTLAVTSEQLLGGTAKSKVGLELKDQYGEKLTVTNSDYTPTAFNKTQNASVTVQWDNTEKSYYIDTTNATNFKLDDEVTVTFLHESTGLTVTKTLKVVTGAQLHSVSLGEVQLPTGKTLLTEDLTNVKVPYTAKDQYGNDTELVKAGNVEVISTDSSVVAPGAVTFTKDGDKTVINIASFLKAGKTNIIILNKVTGETTTLALEVNEKAGSPYAVAVAETATEVASTGTKVLDLTVTDKYGNKVEPKDYVGAAFTTTSSNNAVATAAINTTVGNANYGKLVITSAGTKGDKATITVTLNATGQTSKVDVTIGEAALPFDLAIGKDSKHATSLVVGGATTVAFDVFDQYNTASTTAGYTVEYSLKNASESEFVALSAPDDNTLGTAKVTVTASKAGSATLVAKLVKTAGNETIDVVEIPFTTVANSSDTFTYEVADIAKLYNDGDGADTTLDANEVGPNKHAQAIKVVAKAADGSTLTVPNTSILSVAPATTNVTVAEHTDGTWYVAGSTPGITADTTGKIRINIATDEGTKTIEKEVAISKDAIQIVDVKAMDKAVTDIATAKVKTAVTAATYTDAITFSAGVNPFLWTVDQFGVATDFNVNTANSVTASGFKNITFTSDDTFTKGENTVTVADVNSDTIAAAGSSYRLSIIKDGAAIDLPVTVTTPLAATTAPTATLPVATGANNSATKLVATFNEELYINGTAVANGADVKTSFTLGGTTAGTTSITSAIYDATAKTVTFTVANVDTADTITHNADTTALTDASGNKYAAKVYTYTAGTTLWASN